MWDPGWALEQQVAVAVMVPGTCKKLCPRRTCAAAPPAWALGGMGRGWTWLQVCGVQAAGADLAALQDAQWPCPQHVFLLMPRQAELHKETPIKVLSFGMPSLWRGWAGTGAREVQECIAG